MAIATISPDANFEPQLKLPEAQPDNYMGLTYDNNQTPVVSLLAYIEGAPWTVTYYQQILGAHNDLKELDTGLSAQNQSYSRIDQMELRVQNELEGNTDNSFTATTGTALVYAFLEPNINDYFVTQTSYKRWGLFRVTNVNRHTWRRESVHTIEYRLVDYTERLPKEMESLKLKTTTEYVFAKDRLLEGTTPYLRTEQYQKLVDLRDSRKRIGDYYLNAFINTSCKTLIIPGQPNKRIYDSFLTDFVLATFGFIEFPQCFHIKQIPKDGDVYLDQPQFWDAIIKRDRNLFTYGNKTMMVADTGSFARNTYIKTLYSARMDMIVYPFKPDMSAISGDQLTPVAVFRDCISPTSNGDGKTPSAAEIAYTVEGKSIPAYPPAHVDGYYVLSRAFYDQVDTQLTLLELMTRDYLESKTLDLSQLSFLINLYPKMPRLEQFYYGPLLLTLMKYSDKTMY